MREIERHGDTRHAVRGKPFLGKPHVRAEVNAALFELDVKARDPPPQGGTLDAQLQIAKPQVQQLLVGKTSPRQRLTAPRGGGALPCGSDAALYGGCRRHGRFGFLRARGELTQGAGGCLGLEVIGRGVEAGQWLGLAAAKRCAENVGQRARHMGRGGARGLGSVEAPGACGIGHATRRAREVPGAWRRREHEVLGA